MKTSIALGCLISMLVLVGCGHDTLPQPAARTAVNLNTATAGELSRLPMIGPGTAQLIVEYRTAHGEFSSLDQLLEIRGITPPTLEAIRPFVALRDGAPAAALLNLNTATVPALVKLPGIGQTKAVAIIAYRNQHGPYRKLEDLAAVPGISTADCTEIAPYVTVGE